MRLGSLCFAMSWGSDSGTLTNRSHHALRQTTLMVARVRLHVPCSQALSRQGGVPPVKRFGYSLFWLPPFRHHASMFTFDMYIGILYTPTGT